MGTFEQHIEEELDKLSRMHFNQEEFDDYKNQCKKAIALILVESVCSIYSAAPFFDINRLIGKE